MFTELHRHPGTTGSGLVFLGLHVLCAAWHHTAASLSLSPGIDSASVLISVALLSILLGIA